MSGLGLLTTAHSNFSKISFRFPTDEDICDLAENLRRSDIEELAAVCDFSPAEAVLLSVRASDAAFLRAWHADGRLLCIAGCSPQALNLAAPWLLATPLLDRYGKCLMREARAEVRMMLARYETLRNVIDVRQVATLKWLRALGFELTEGLEIKPGLPVVRFERRREIAWSDALRCRSAHPTIF